MNNDTFPSTESGAAATIAKPAPKKTTIVYACSGCSDAGEIADRVARQLSREGAAQMSCLAGIGGRVKSLIMKAGNAGRILVVDGCPLNCAAHTLRLAGFKNFEHLELHKIGIRKGFCPVTDDKIAAGVEAAKKMLAVPNTSNPTIYLDHVDANGVMQFAQSEGYGCNQPGDGVELKDVYAMGPNGDRHYAQCAVLYWDAYGSSGPWKATHMLGHEYAGTPPYSDTSHYINYISWGSNTPAGTQVYGPWVRGAESDQVGNYVWYVEAVDCTASRWVVPDETVGVGNAYNYAGPVFGVPGVASDNDNRLYDPKDITRDSANEYYVLDHLSTDLYTIKAFTYISTATTAKGSFGDSTSWELTPIRIEGSDFNPNIVVLHTSGNNSEVSVFTDAETP